VQAAQLLGQAAHSFSDIHLPDKQVVPVQVTTPVLASLVQAEHPSGHAVHASPSTRYPALQAVHLATVTVVVDGWQSPVAAPSPLVVSQLASHFAHNPAVVNVYPVLHVVHVVAEAHDAQFVTAEQSVQELLSNQNPGLHPVHVAAAAGQVSQSEGVQATAQAAESRK